MKQSEVDTLKRYSSEIRREGEAFVKLADEIDKHVPSLLGLGESQGKAHLSAEGLQKATEAARDAWHPCPRGCKNRAGEVKKHRADHVHIRRSNIEHFPTRRAAAA